MKWRGSNPVNGFIYIYIYNLYLHIVDQGSDIHHVMKPIEKIIKYYICDTVVDEATHDSGYYIYLIWPVLLFEYVPQVEDISRCSVIQLFRQTAVHEAPVKFICSIQLAV